MPISPSRARTAFRATCLVYALLGFGTAAWLSRLPDVRDDLGLTPATIGTMLLIASLGSLLTLPTSGPIVTKIGATHSGRIGALIWCGGVACAGAGALSAQLPLATLGLVGISAGTGLWGATMNIEAGLVQAALRRPVVPVIQAMYAVGMLAGALAGAVASHAGLPLGAHLFGLASLELIACALAVGFYLTREEVTSLSAPAPRHTDVESRDGATASGTEEKTKEKTGKGLTRRAWREKQTVLIALMVMSAGLMEGAANDWLNLSMVDGYAFTTAGASATFAFFLLMMTLVRFSSPRLQSRLGSPLLLRVTFSGAVVGLLLVAFAPHHSLALVGVGLWGIGAALGFPLGISALSVDPVMTPARVSVLSTVNYGSALIGPPLLGLIADHVGYHRALAFVAIPVVVAIILAGQVPDERGRASRTRADLAFDD